MSDADPSLDTPPTVTYANAVRVHGGPYDVGIDFGQRVRNDEPAFESRIFMSWTHVAALHRILGGMIDSYEQRTGQSIPDAETAFAEQAPE